MKTSRSAFPVTIEIIYDSVRFGSVRFLMLSVRFGSIQPTQKFHRFRFGSVFKILVSIRFNFRKTRTDPNTGIYQRKTNSRAISMTYEGYDWKLYFSMDTFERERFYN